MDGVVIRAAVVGGGFAGLSAAIRLKDLAEASGTPLELTVFESQPSVGGRVATKKMGDYLVETGADAFITNKPGGVELCTRLGLESRLLTTLPASRKSFILSQGRPVQTPAGFQLIAPTLRNAFLKTPLLSWPAKKRVLAEPHVPGRTETTEESVGAFIRRRFGAEAFDRVIQPMVGGIYTGDLDRLSLSATFPRFVEMERRHGSILKALKRERSNVAASGARYGLFVSLPGGMGELLQAMQAEVSRQHTVRLSQSVSGMTRLPDGRWSLSTQDGASEFDLLVLAIPADQAARLLKPVEVGLADELDGIEYSSSAIVVSGHSLSDVAHPLNGAGLVIPHVEGRQILAVSFASRKFPGRAPTGKVILRTFLGGALQASLLERDDAELKVLVRSELRQVLGVQGEPDFCEVVRYHRGIPQFVIGHQDRVGRIEQSVRQLPGFGLAGNAYYGVGIPDAITSGFDAAAKVWADRQGSGLNP